MSKTSANSFNKGMNLDIPNYQYPSDILSYCRNCDFLTGEGNESILQNIKGNNRIDGLKENYFPVAIKEYGGIAYIVSAEVSNNTFTGRGEIGTFPSPDYSSLSLRDSRTLVGTINYENPVYSPLKNYFKEDLDESDISLTDEDLILYGTASSSYGDFNTELFNFTEFSEFSIQLQPYYDDTINIIFTDFINPVRIVNTRFTPLSNNIVEIRDRLGSNDTNLYTKLNFNNTLNLSQNSNKVVNLDLDNIGLGGQLKAGVYTYYFSYQTQDGNTTNIIAESFPVTIFHGTTLSDIRGGDPNFLVETNKLVRFKLDNLDTNFDSIKVRYSYSNGEFNTQTEYFELELPFRLNGNSLFIEHNGSENQFTISREELDVDFVSMYTCKSLTQANNRLYAANIKSKFYDQTIFENYASNIKIGHKQKRIEIPYTSPVIDDNSIYSSKVINKIENNNSALSVGYKNGYYNPFNIYYHLPYFPGEKYMYSVRYILDDGSMSNCFPVRGIDNWENDKYITYNTETLNSVNDYFSLTTGENLRGVYRFPYRNTLNSFALRNGDTSYNILSNEESIQPEISIEGTGEREEEIEIFEFINSANDPDLNNETLADYYFAQGGSDPNDSTYTFNDPFSIYSINDCINDPNCNINQKYLDCQTDPNCTLDLESYHTCSTEIETIPTGVPPFEEDVVVGVVCDSDEFNNTYTTTTLVYQNQIDELGNPLGTTYTYTILDTNNSESNILAVTFELPDLDYPEGTIGIQFMRSVVNNKDSISQGYIVDTLPVPSIDIYENEESGNRYTDYKFFDGGMKLVPSVDYVLETPALWDRRGAGRNRRKERSGLAAELSGVKFNSKGWDLTEPYVKYQNFAFISNDLLTNPAYLSSSLVGGNFKFRFHNKINLYTSIDTSSEELDHFSLYKTIGSSISSYDNTVYSCNLDWIESDVSSKTPNGFSSRCLFTGTNTRFIGKAFCMFPLKFNSYIGVNIEEDIELSLFSSKVEDDVLGARFRDEGLYGGQDPNVDVTGLVKDSAALVSIYPDLGFDLGTNSQDLSRIKGSLLIENTSYTPISKRLYWQKPVDELDSVDLSDFTEQGKIVLFGGDCFTNLGIRKLFTNIFDENEEALDNEAKLGKVGYSISLVNDSIHNPLFRTIEIPDQSESPLNYYPNYLSTSPNSIGNKYGSGNQWRDYQNLESSAFNFGALKTVTDRSYISLVGRVPFLNNNFSTRIMYSELHNNSDIENRFRNFLPSAYRDYSKEMGSITGITVLNNSNNYIICIQESGTSLIPIADRSLVASTDLSTSAGQLLFEGSGILPTMDRVQVLSKTHGTKWLSSIVNSNSAVYYVDIENTKIVQLSPTISFISDYNIQSFLLKVKDTYSYKSVNLLNKNIYSYYDLKSNNVHFTFRDSICSAPRQDENPYAWEVSYEILEEYVDGFLTGNEKPNLVGDPDYIEPEIYNQEESPCPLPEPEPFPLDVDIYVVWDTTSFNPTLKANLQQNVIAPWIQDFRNTYPQWTGNFSQIDSAPTTEGEGWLDYVNLLPINSDKVVVICMIDESHNAYHGEDIPTGWGTPSYPLAQADALFTAALSTPGETQPQQRYIDHYNNFVNLYNNRFEYFKGMVYGIPSAPNDLPGLFAQFQLHAYCAIEGTTVSPIDFIETGIPGKSLSLIQSENLYSTIGLGLKNYGWQEKHQFSGQASDLSLEEFTNDINPLILENNDGFTGWRPKLDSAICTPLYKTLCDEVTPVLTQNVSYNEPRQVWNSFWGFYPSYAFNLYNKHYTLNGINENDYSSIWLHESNSTRCNFYGTQDEFVFEFVVANEIQFQKVFTNFILICNEVPPVFIEYTTDNEPNIDDVGVNPTKRPRIQTVYPTFRGRYKSPYIDQTDPTLSNTLRYNAQYKENHMYIQINDDYDDMMDGYTLSNTEYRTNSRIRDKYLKVKFRYRGDEYSIIQAVITAYQISFS